MRLCPILACILFCSLPITATCAEPPVKIGDRVDKLKFTDIHYLTRTLSDFGPKKAYALVFINTTCPLAKRYLPVVQGLSNDFGADVQFIAVNSAEQDSIIGMATQAVQHDITFPVVKDRDEQCARKLGIERTPVAVVLDAQYRLRFRGRIDDQFRLSGNRAEPTRRDLKEALDAVLAGRDPKVTETEVDGCPITFPQPRKPREVTFAEHVAPILQKHCWQCHRDDGSAPFSLTAYDQASSHAESLAEVVADGRMPPWFASHDFGPFTNRRGMSTEERTIIQNWARSGAPRGDDKKAPQPPPKPKSNWLIGEPDLVLEVNAHELPATGDIPYKYAILPRLFTSDTWIQAAQIIPDNPRVLHHCNMGFGNLKDGMKEENFITGYVPGGEAMTLDDGVAFRIPKGSVIGLQMHYVPTGKPETCKVSVGFRFPRVPVQKRLQHYQLFDQRFAIPPGAPAHKVSASRVLDRDIIGVGLFAHMHLRGKDMTFTSRPTDGNTETLLIIPNYNFSWQVPYRWESGKKRFAKGTRLDCVAHFDNSAFNPYNPNPKSTVRFGQQTRDEMMYGFFFYLEADEQLNLQIDSKTGKQK